MSDADEENNSWSGKRALITGASSGIGQAMARQLAARGCNLVITARRHDRLRSLANELQQHHGVDIEVVALDLLEKGAVRALKETLDEKNIAIDVLVNNAGFGYQEQFVVLEWEKVNRMIDLDVRVMTEMAHVFARDMVVRGASGSILNVGSIFSYGGVAGYATYSAAKGYVLNFTEALRAELAPRGIKVSMLAPGVTATEFFETANEGDIPSSVSGIMLTSDEVALSGLKAMARNRPVEVSGMMYKIMTQMRRILPRSWVVNLWLRAATKEEREEFAAPLK